MKTGRWRQFRFASATWGAGFGQMDDTARFHEQIAAPKQREPEMSAEGCALYEKVVGMMAEGPATFEKLLQLAPVQQPRLRHVRKVSRTSA